MLQGTRQGLVCSKKAEIWLCLIVINVLRLFGTELSCAKIYTRVPH